MANLDTDLGELWRALTGEPLEPGAVAFTGAESVLPGPFRVAAAAATSVAATTLAAAELLRLRGVEPGRVSVDLGHAAAAFRSERYLLVDGGPPGDVWAELSGDYRAADGWVRLHCNYPQHAAAACRALGVPESREAVTEAVAARGAWQVQEEVLAAGGAAAALRSRADWLAHPQGRAVTGLPLAELTRTGHAAPVPLPDSGRPLGGVRVLELTHVIAGPVAGRTLAAHGADVLHIGAAHLPVVRPLVIDTGLGKRSAWLDLRTDAGRDRLWALIAGADVFIQSFRPGALAGLGFSADRLAAARPGLVQIELNAYGWAGPWAGRRGFDSLVQLATGIAAEGAADAPVPLPAQALDHATGWLAAAVAMTALRRRAAEGGGWRARLALARTGEWLDSLGGKDPAATEPDLTALLTTTQSQFGELTHVRAPGALPASNPQWTHGSPLPGGDSPNWPRE
ncbi:CoA transferase [Amycolatopsis nigrescens]|uniref:CoA transferase n=1 Tax=Amycolatopsis nigrescens TaxID=381445 RepID=UPI000378D19B|nr:CoA transferase [Amycolatopsis nigrescens]